MGKVYTHFQTKTLPDGAAHTHMAYIGEYSPPGIQLPGLPGKTYT